MSMAVITLREEEEGSLNVRVEFEPQLDTNDDAAEPPLSHQAAMAVLLHLKELFAE